MKPFFFFLFLTLCCLKLTAQTGMKILQEDRISYVVHKVAAGETIYQLARDYHVKPSAILKFNELGNDTRVRSGQSLRIPLTETNFFRMSGLTEASGFLPLWYTIRDGDTREGLLKRFVLSPQAFDSWNRKAAFQNGHEVIVGWLKYEKGTREVAAYIAREQQELSRQRPGEEEKIVMESPTSTEKSFPVSILNPRYVDPDQRPARKPVSTTTPLYARSDVKKQSRALKDDTHDAWYQFKRLFASDKERKQPGRPSDYVSDMKEIEGSKQRNSMAKKTEVPVKPIPKQNVPKSLTSPASRSAEQTPKRVSPTADARPPVYREAGRQDAGGWTKVKRIFRTGATGKKEKETPKAMPKLVRKDPNRSPGVNAQAFWGKVKNTFSFERKKSYTSYVPPTERLADKDKPNPAEDLSVRTKSSGQAEKPASPGHMAKGTPANQKQSLWNKLLNGRESPPPQPRGKPASKPKPASTSGAVNRTPVQASENRKTTSSDENRPLIDPVVRNEILPLSLNHTRSGRGAYFFGGPSGGKFYVATNLVAKGRVVKVTNPENGKFIMAEVLSPLPASDVSKGLLLKVSDNAKLPLGQKGSVFTLRINY